MQIHKQSSSPLYQQIREEIASDIETNKLKYGEKIDTEIELSQKYGVSRITIRKAISDLVTEGYLVKKQGKGTFVRKPKIQRKIEHLLSFTESCKINNMSASSYVIKKETFQATNEEKLFFCLDDHDLVIHIQRICSADGCPIIFENLYFPHKFFAGLMEDNLCGSLFELLSHKYGITPSQSTSSTLEMTYARGEVAQRLSISNGTPLFYMKSNITDSNDQPIYIAKLFIVGEKYKFYIP